MARYRQKPVVVTAMQWTGKNTKAVRRFCRWLEIAAGGGGLMFDTMDKMIHMDVGDWIVRGVDSKFRPVKQELFSQLYEAYRK